MPFVLQFDARTVAPNVIPEPIPTAIYTAMITKSEEKNAKTPGATYYEFIETITEGEFKGRTLTDRLNCKNPSQQAMEIAYSTLSSICHVCGVFPLTNSQELHNKPFKINVVKIPRNDDPSRMTNEIRGYLHMDGSEPGKVNTTMASAAPAAGFSTGAPAPNGQTAAWGAPPAQQAAATTWQVMPANPGFEMEIGANGVPTSKVRPVQQAAPAPAPQQQFAPAPQPAPAQQQFAPAPTPQQFAPPPQQAAPATVFQRADGVLVNAAGQPVDQFGNPLPQAAQPIPQQYQPAPQQQFAPAPQQSGQPSATPDWAK